MNPLGPVLFGLGAVVAIACLYLVALACAALFHRPFRSIASPVHRLAVLVPAHDEAVLIGRCLESLARQPYPAHLLRVIVIADNCTDGTAAIAHASGVEVMVRHEPSMPGKGRALRWAMDRLLAEADAPDAIVVVDADSVADSGLLIGLEAELQRGATVAQALYLVLNERGSSREHLLRAAFLLFHHVRPAGRAVLGMPASLVGNGMIFSRRLLETHPWNAFTAVEDLEYTIQLRLAGVRPALASTARIYAPAAGSAKADAGQRARWEGGRFHLVRTRLWPIIAAAWSRRDLSLIDVAIDLAVPPLSLLVLVAAAGGVGSAALAVIGVAPLWAAAPWIAALVALPLYVFIGLRAGEATRATYQALAAAPLLIVRKTLVYVRLARGHDAQRWNRTDRTAAVAEPVARFDILGIPIDPVDMDGAVDRITDAIGGPNLYQVCTVNVDFLMNAHTNPEMARILKASSLNLADGAPVVWLGRLLGRRLPARVAGADLIPRLVEVGSERGISFFLLGGQDGVAAAAAAQLRARHPELEIAGTHEPPRARLEDLDSDDIVERVNASGADVLMVAFGHPKQERWIELNRHRLNVSVAVGVGCCFDLIAGRQKRAPSWMHPLGLEWAYRLLNEPGRLLQRYAADASWLVLRALPGVIAQRRRTA